VTVPEGYSYEIYNRDDIERIMARAPRRASLRGASSTYDQRLQPSERDGWPSGSRDPPRPAEAFPPREYLQALRREVCARWRVACLACLCAKQESFSGISLWRRVTNLAHALQAADDDRPSFRDAARYDDRADEGRPVCFSQARF
jgi:hypothetical protein